MQGTVTIPAGVTPTGPLYVGYYNQSTNTVYATRIASPGSSNPFTVYVPTDTNNDYIFFEILDQNNDGLIDAGDVSNTSNNSSGIADQRAVDRAKPYAGYCQQHRHRGNSVLSDDRASRQFKFQRLQP